MGDGHTLEPARGTHVQKPHHNGHAKARQHKHVAAKQDKKFVVEFTNAVVHPRAVMVHLTDTTLAGAAVVGTKRLVDIAPTACCDQFAVDPLGFMAFDVAERWGPQWTKGHFALPSWCNDVKMLQYFVFMFEKNKQSIIGPSNHAISGNQ